MVIRFRMNLSSAITMVWENEWTRPTNLVAPPLYAFYFQSTNSDCLGYHTRKSLNFLVLFLSEGVPFQ